MTNIIADIAGHYKTLLKLVEQMPDGELISLGDMIDRGPDSKRVLEFFMKPGRRAILGNHEHMMYDHETQGGFYANYIWVANGGRHTLESFPNYEVPQEYLDWIASLPLYIEIDGCLLSHSFLRPSALDDQVVLKENCKLGKNIYEKDETTIIWNRRQPIKRESWRLQICGHNSQFGLQWWHDDEGDPFAVCLDDSSEKRLTGYCLETDTIYQQDYID